MNSFSTIGRSVEEVVKHKGKGGSFIPNKSQIMVINLINHYSIFIGIGGANEDDGATDVIDGSADVTGGDGEDGNIAGTAGTVNADAAAPTQNQL